MAQRHESGEHVQEQREQWEDGDGGDGGGRSAGERAAGRPRRVRQKIEREPVPWERLPLLMTLGQAASGLGIAETSFRKILDTTPSLSALVVFQPGGSSRRIKRDALRRWLEGQWNGERPAEPLGSETGEHAGRYLRRRQRAGNE